jgi:precorrin-4/cobalt-precorrin-4 C11-methyltransferase
MQRLDSHAIGYGVIPGVTSAAGAAASLKTELTLPEVSQTVIITRQEGRTPVPELERLRSLASHQTTMMIFLSVSMIDKVIEELVGGGYSTDTPVVVVEKATWDDEKIVRGTIDDIADKVRHEGIRKTAMICVGKVFSDSDISAESKLYDSTFSHGTRTARNG